MHAACCHNRRALPCEIRSCTQDQVPSDSMHPLPCQGPALHDEIGSSELVFARDRDGIQ